MDANGAELNPQNRSQVLAINESKGAAPSESPSMPEVVFVAVGRAVL